MIFTYALNIITNPVFILSKLWRLSYFPLINYFKLPIDNHNHESNSHVLSLIFSIVMSLLTPYSYYLIYNGYWDINQINSHITNFIYNFSLSYFISDLIIGIEYYPIILNKSVLTSYVHHSAYIGLLIYGKYYNRNYLFIFGLPYEIPTILLNLGHVNPKYKNYQLFGLLFFVCRILHNIFLLYKTFMVYNDLFIFSVCTFILHCNWFKGWANKYFLRQ